MPEVVVIDACQRQGRGGSPTAVLDETSFTDEERCRIPGELGTSTIFVRATRVERGRPSYSLRFFTAEGELPACGHGTVAALALLAIREGGSHDHAVLCTTSRSFEGWAIRNRDSVTASFDPGPVNLRVAQAPEPRAVTAGLGLADEAVVGNACVASYGRPRLLLPVRSRTALANLSPDFALLRAACDRYGLLGCYAYPDLGEIPEDAVPGPSPTLFIKERGRGPGYVAEALMRCACCTSPGSEFPGSHSVMGGRVAP